VVGGGLGGLEIWDCWDRHRDLEGDSRRSHAHTDTGIGSGLSHTDSHAERHTHAHTFSFTLVFSLTRALALALTFTIIFLHRRTHTDTHRWHRKEIRQDRRREEAGRSTEHRITRLTSIGLEGMGTEGQQERGKLRRIGGQSDTHTGSRIDRVTGLSSWFMHSLSELNLV
jgi:hypothetical protein